MELFWAGLLFCVGLVLVVKGGDFFVDAAGWMSDVTGISRAVIGATVVSFATTSPEYFVSLIAVLKGSNDLSIGNAVGSLICNLGIGFAVLAFFMPDKVRDKLFGVKGFMMILATVLLLVFSVNGLLTIWEGLVLLGVFLVFTFINIRFSKEEDRQKTKKETNRREIAVNIAKFIGGAAAIVVGADIIVNNGQLIAAYLGVSEAIIGLTVVAIGTSLPELVTSITAIVKKENEISIGNIIGANTLDATLILATSAFVSEGGLVVSASTVRVDLPATLVLMALAVIPTAIGKKVYKWQGLAMALVYGAYLAYILICQAF